MGILTIPLALKNRKKPRFTDFPVPIENRRSVFFFGFSTLRKSDKHVRGAYHEESEDMCHVQSHHRVQVLPHSRETTSQGIRKVEQRIAP